MSFTGLWLTACLPPSVDLSGVISLDDLASVPLDESTSVLAFTRNGWLCNRIEEIAQAHRIASLPMGDNPAVACVDTALDVLIADLRAVLASLRQAPDRLPAEALAHADDGEVERCLAMAPASHDDAIAAFRAAVAGDAEGEHLETLFCLLWCQFRLAEHALANGLRYLSLRGQ